MFNNFHKSFHLMILILRHDHTISTYYVTVQSQLITRWCNSDNTVVTATIYSWHRQVTINTTYRPLWTASASISSKKIIAGAAARALRNNSRTAFSDSPTHLDSNSGPWYKWVNMQNKVTKHEKATVGQMTDIMVTMWMAQGCQLVL